MVIDEAGGCETPSDGNYTVTIERSQLKWTHRGFKLLGALGQLVRQGLSCEMVVLFDDDTLFYGKSFDTWALAELKLYDAGILGVGAEGTYSGWFPRCVNLFDAWGLSYHRHDVGVRPIIDNLQCLSWSFVKELFTRDMLPPPHWQEWPLSVGAYLSWAAQLLNYRQVGWGQEDRPIAPLYLDSTTVSPRLVPPSILSNEFSVHGSIRKVRGYDESAIRHWAADRRAAKPTIVPVVSDSDEGKK